MQPYATWKYVVLILVMILGGLYAAPNLFGEDPAVQIATQSGDPLASDFGEVVSKSLATAAVTAKRSELNNQQWLINFNDEGSQRTAADALKRDLGNGYVVALTFASKTPEWLHKIGAKPMTLGLDLRGGVHFLLEVDLGDVKKKAVERYLTDLPAFLRKQDIRYTGRHQTADAVQLDFADADKLGAAKTALSKEYSELTVTVPPASPLTLEAKMSDTEAKRIVDFAVKQNLTTLRNRVNQLGVAEPLVQRQGQNRIVVELPGVTDATQVESLLGATATLEYRAVDDSDANTAAASGVVPADSELFYTRNGHRPVLLKRDVIAAGSQLVDAASTVDQDGSPAVSVTLDGSGAKKMFDFTEKNVGKPMAVLFKEREVVTNYNAKGEPMREHRDVEEIISIATIRGVFGKRFQTTGLQSKEAHDLAILLRAGALAAPVDIVEVRTVGPSLGADNIRRGFQAAVLGLALVMVFMIFYYRVFGAFAIAALVLNIVLIIAGMSIMSATLTMPGIAAMVLTMGIAVDANVLIYERIREELRDGKTPHAAIEAGYDRAFLTIADANVTVLIGTLVLFVMGAGPVKGFAITLALGIVTSQFTSIVGTRSLAYLVFAKRKLKDLPIW